MVGCTMGELRREQSTGCAEERREVESMEVLDSMERREESMESEVKELEMELDLSRERLSQELMVGTSGQLDRF